MKQLIIITTLTCLLLTGCGGHAVTDPTQNTTDPTVPSTSAPATTAPTMEPTVPPTTVPTVPPTTAPTVPPTTAPQSVTFAVYHPNDDYTAFVHEDVTLQSLSAEAVLQELINVGIVNADVAVNSAMLNGTQLSLDLSGTFLNQLYTLGTTGEHFVIGSIVNTFLGAYGAETVLITADGSFMDSGHVVYDFPLSFVE